MCPMLKRSLLYTKLKRDILSVWSYEIYLFLYYEFCYPIDFNHFQIRLKIIFQHPRPREDMSRIPLV